MTKRSTPARVSSRRAPKAEIERLRARMDRLNAELVALVQRRARLALAIDRVKRRDGLPAADPARERAMLAKALARAPRGFEREELARLLRAHFAASRRLLERERRRAARP